jgi:hypothetical protein
MYIRMVGKKRRRRTGSAAIMAVAVIIIVGFLGAALVSSVVIAQSSSADASLGVQAFYVADAGAQWACKQDTATSSAISFGSGAFDVTADGDEWVSVGTADWVQRIIRCEPVSFVSISDGLDYITGSREEHHSKIPFHIMNNTTGNIVFDRMSFTWDSPTAYIEKMKIDVIDYQNHGTVWNHANDPEGRWPSGETREFTTGGTVTIPPHYTAFIKPEKICAQSNGSGSADMNSTTVTVRLYNGSTLVAEIILDPPVQP